MEAMHTCKRAHGGCVPKPFGVPLCHRYSQLALGVDGYDRAHVLPHLLAQRL
jgi:hypothetical protein